MGKFSVAEVSAKVNLTLDAAPKGYAESDLHNLTSVVVPFPALSDRVKVTAREDDEVTVTYSDGAIYLEDRVVKAVKALAERYGTPGADVYVERGIPEGVGIGSSSAPAAGAVKCLSALYGIPIENDFLVTLGSDVPVQVYGRTAIVSGRGEEITPVELPPMCLTLVYGKERVGTREVFSLYDLIGGAGGNAEEFLVNYMPFNSLEAAAAAIRPEILKARRLLSAAGFTRIVMTGSGAGYVGIALDLEENLRLFTAAARLADSHNLTIVNSVIEN